MKKCHTHITKQQIKMTFSVVVQSQTLYATMCDNMSCNLV